MPVERLSELIQFYVKTKTNAIGALSHRKMAQATRIKHLRQAGTLIKRRAAGVPAKLTLEQLGTLSPSIAKPPLKFTDDDFQTLYDAFRSVAQRIAESLNR